MRRLKHTLHALTRRAVLRLLLVASIGSFGAACGDDDDALHSPPAECTRKLDCELTKGRWPVDGGLNGRDAAYVEVRAAECFEGTCLRVIEEDGVCRVQAKTYDCSLSDDRILEMVVAERSTESSSRDPADAATRGTGETSVAAGNAKP